MRDIFNDHSHWVHKFRDVLVTSWDKLYIVLHVRGSADRWIMCVLFITAAAPLHHYFALWCIFDDGVDWHSFYVHTQAQTLPPVHLQMGTSINTSFHKASLYTKHFNACVFVLNDPSGMLSVHLLLAPFVRYSRPSSMHICVSLLFFDSSVHNALHYKQWWLLKITVGFCIFTCLVTCD